MPTLTISSGFYWTNDITVSKATITAGNHAYLIGGAAAGYAYQLKGENIAGAMEKKLANAISPIFPTYFISAESGLIRSSQTRRYRFQCFFRNSVGLQSLAFLNALLKV